MKTKQNIHMFTIYTVIPQHVNLENITKFKK